MLTRRGVLGLFAGLAGAVGLGGRSGGRTSALESVGLDYREQIKSVAAPSPPPVDIFADPLTMYLTKGPSPGNQLSRYLEERATRLTHQLWLLPSGVQLEPGQIDLWALVDKAVEIPCSVRKVVTLTTGTYTEDVDTLRSFGLSDQFDRRLLIPALKDYWAGVATQPGAKVATIAVFVRREAFSVMLNVYGTVVGGTVDWIQLVAARDEMNRKLLSEPLFIRGQPIEKFIISTPAGYPAIFPVVNGGMTGPYYAGQDA